MAKVSNKVKEFKKVLKTAGSATSTASSIHPPTLPFLTRISNFKATREEQFTHQPWNENGCFSCCKETVELSLFLMLKYGTRVMFQFNEECQFSVSILWSQTQTT